MAIRGFHISLLFLVMLSYGPVQGSLFSSSVNMYPYSYSTTSDYSYSTRSDYFYSTTSVYPSTRSEYSYSTTCDYYSSITSLSASNTVAQTSSSTITLTSISTSLGPTSSSTTTSSNCQSGSGSCFLQADNLGSTALTTHPSLFVVLVTVILACLFPAVQLMV